VGFGGGVGGWGVGGGQCTLLLQPRDDSAAASPAAWSNWYRTHASTAQQARERSLNAPSMRTPSERTCPLPPSRPTPAPTPRTSAAPACCGSCVCAHAADDLIPMAVAAMTVEAGIEE